MFPSKNKSPKQSFDQLMSEFKVAVFSECSIDDHYRHAFGFNDNSFVGLPRPSRWVGFAKKYPAMLIAIFQFAKLAWVLGGGVAYFFYQLSVYFIKSLFVPYKTLGGQVETEFALGFSNRAMDVIGECSIGRQPDFWILFPWVRKKNHDKSLHVIDALSMVNFADFIIAFTLSVRALYTVGLARSGRGVGSMILPTYIAFQWFLARVILSKFNAKFFILSEHHDRWAVLADYLVKSKLVYGTSLVVVQHGVESNLKAAHRLRAVSRLYVYDEESLMAFENNIIDVGFVKDKLDVCFYMPRLTLKPLDNYKFPYKISVLVVGHPSEEPLHVNLYKTLLEGLDINVIYKPHPTVRESKIVRKMGWFIWRDTEEFPVVDILISYPSTLVEEYHAVGIGAVIHPCGLGVDVAESYFSNVSAVLEVILSRVGGEVVND